MNTLTSVLPSAFGSLHPLEASFFGMADADVQQVMAVEHLAYAWPWSEGNMRDSIRNGHCCQVLRNTRHQLLGYFIAMPGIDEVHQRQGWARVMLDALVGWAGEIGSQWVWLEVRVSNARAIGIYEQYGFRRVGLRKAYYPMDGSQREDAIVMSKQV
jgi:[ribosomal protein S18]-alanine N-acetyltransferase